MSGPFNRQKDVQDNGGMNGNTSISRAYGRSRLKVCHKISDEVGSRMHLCGAPMLVPLPSSVRAHVSRAHAPYSRSTINLALSRDRKYPPYVPRFA